MNSTTTIDTNDNNNNNNNNNRNITRENSTNNNNAFGCHSINLTPGEIVGILMFCEIFTLIWFVVYSFEAVQDEVVGTGKFYLILCIAYPRFYSIFIRLFPILCSSLGFLVIYPIPYPIYHISLSYPSII